ncbi:MAG: pectinesterase family protein [Oscillospiraceae bacterium]|nr:pectinesterase family protein [Oscillospiraceae bacterium]
MNKVILKKAAGISCALMIMCCAAANAGYAGFTDITSERSVYALDNISFSDNADIIADCTFSGADGQNVNGVPVYRTVQAAINAAHENDTVFVKKGNYNERVTVSKANITVVGEDSQNTRIYYSVASKDVSSMYDRNCMKIESSATGFTLANITVENTYPYTNGSDEQADAVCVRADCAVFACVRFVGFQDTLLADSGSSSAIARQYYYKCYITGNVDFIYGRARAFFDECDIVGRYTQYKKDGCFCAPRTSLENQYGFVFNKCNFKGENGVAQKSYRLGRPWGADASMTFLKCYMDASVKDECYSDMGDNLYVNARFSEYNSYGSGAAVNSTRPQLNDSQAAMYTIDNVFKAGVSTSFDYKSKLDALTQQPQATTVSQTTTQSQTQTQPQAVQTIICSPDANSSGSGTYSDPMPLKNAVESLKPGGVIWLKGGVYKFNETINIPESNSGTESAYKTISAIKGEDVVFDFSAMPVSGSNRGVVLQGSWWHWYGICIQKCGDNGMLLSGNHNIIEMCVFQNNQDTGLQISRYNSSYASVDKWPSYNYIKNCTARNNCDDATMENADGFAAKLTCGQGNLFDGCLSYNNSDDGWDLYAKTETGPIGIVTFKNCISFRNGFTEDGRGYGDCDGNGFKLGGAGVGTAHVLENCLSFENLHHGFTDNNNPLFGSLTSCTSYANSQGGSKANFQMDRCSAGKFSKLLSVAGNGKLNNDKLNGTAANSVIYNGGKYWSITSQVTIASTSAGTQITGPSSGDFINASAPPMGTDFHKIWRNSDGTINTNGFLVLKSSGSFSGTGADQSLFSVQTSTPLPVYDITPPQTTPAVTTVPVTETTTVVTTTSEQVTTTSMPEIMYGDIDKNKVVEMTDLTMLSQYLLGDIYLDETQLQAADVNGDTRVQLADLSHLKQYIMMEEVTLGPVK